MSKLFSNTSMDFTKRCRMRIGYGIGFLFLGALALAAACLYGTKIPVSSFYTAEIQESVSNFYAGTGCGLIAASIVKIIRNVRYLKNPDLQKKRALYENDERNQMIGTKCWSYAGYALFFLLYVGILISGFINILVLKVLLGVLAAYAALLLIFKLVLTKVM